MNKSLVFAIFLCAASSTAVAGGKGGGNHNNNNSHNNHNNHNNHNTIINNYTPNEPTEPSSPANVDANSNSNSNSDANASAAAEATSRSDAMAVGEGGNAEGYGYGGTSDVDVTSTYSSSYEEAARTAMVSVSSYCHTGAGIQTQQVGLSVTTRSKVCDLLSIAQLKFNIASGMRCEAGEVVDKGGKIILPNQCMRLRTVFFEEALAYIDEAHAEIERKPGYVKRFWQAVIW